MDYRPSRHVEEQLIVQNISRTALAAMLQNPEQRFASEGRWVYQSRVTLDGRLFLLRAVIDENAEPFLVVTVYRTTKIAQYWKPE